MSVETGGFTNPPVRAAFSTLAFPGATLASAVSLGRRWGYAGVELRLVDGELIDPRMPAADRARVKQTVVAAGLPVVAVDSSIRLTGEDPGPDLRRFLELASDWESPLVRVFGGALAADPAERQEQLRAAARVLESCVPLARRLGVAIGVETHDDFSASSVVAELLAMADPDWVGAVWDSHHPHRMGEPPADVYANLGRRILLAQVKDARRGPAVTGSWSCLARARCRSGRCSACSRRAATRAGSRSSGRSAGTPRSPSRRSRCRSTSAC